VYVNVHVMKRIFVWCGQEIVYVRVDIIYYSLYISLYAMHLVMLSLLNAT